MLSALAANRIDQARTAVIEALAQCNSDAYRAAEPRTGPSRKAAAKLSRALDLLESLSPPKLPAELPCIKGSMNG